MNSTNNTNQVWCSFAERHQAKYSIIRFGNSDFIEFIHEPYGISLDNFTIYRTVSKTTVSKTYTRAKAEFRINREFDFKMRPLRFLDKVSRWFNKEKFQLFTSDYIIFTKGMISADHFLGNANLKTCLANYRDLEIELFSRKDAWDGEIQEGFVQLSITKEGLSNTETELSDLVDLLRELINTLLQFGLIK